MKLNVTNLLTVAAAAALHLSACNTIKGLLGDDEAAKTEAVPTAEATETAAPADTAPEATAPADPSAAPTAEAPTIAAANEADVKRFDDEQKLDAPADTKIKDKATSVLKEPPDVAVVALLKPGH